MSTDKFECSNCGSTEMSRNDVLVCVFNQTQEEPAEYDFRCPECNSSEVEEMTAFFCFHCDDVQVGDEGDYCSECTAELIDSQRDAILDGMAERRQEYKTYG